MTIRFDSEKNGQGCFWTGFEAELEEESSETAATETESGNESSENGQDRCRSNVSDSIEAFVWRAAAMKGLRIPS